MAEQREPQEILQPDFGFVLKPQNRSKRLQVLAAGCPVPEPVRLLQKVLSRWELRVVSHEVVYIFRDG